MAARTTSSIDTVPGRWHDAWPDALAAWSRYTRLQFPQFFTSRKKAARAGLSGSFAMIRLADQRIVIDLETVSAYGLDDFAVEILAHEIGHHVYAPGNATDHFRLLARIRGALPTLERFAPMVANLYTDLYINDRLQRRAGLRMDGVYRRIAQNREGESPGRLWMLYMGMYEQLWQLDRGILGGPADDEALRADAWLGARLIRVYAEDWLDAGGRFASLLLPYLVADTDEALTLLHDTRAAGEGSRPSGILEVEDDETRGAVHPVLDPRVTGRDEEPPPTGASNAPNQMREPFEYGEILRAAGAGLSDHDIAVRYYRERALPYLVKFPQRRGPESPEPQLEGLEPWELGDPLDELDWLQTLLQSPRVVPGVTTVRRHYGREAGVEQMVTPVDLDLYVDSSGSMPNPQTHTSWPALAGAVIALSALRAGSKVQATLWSGKRQVTHTNGFVRNGDEILKVLTGFYGGATAFPIHRLRDTYRGRPSGSRAVHLLMISDDGITTMFDTDEQGNSGWDIVAEAMQNGGAGGTMALTLSPYILDTNFRYAVQTRQALERAQREQGWDIHTLNRQEDLLAFARAFSARHYAPRADGMP